MSSSQAMQANIQAISAAILGVQTTDNSLQDQIAAAIDSMTKGGQAVKSNIQTLSNAILQVQTTDISLQNQLTDVVVSITTNT